MGDESEVFRSGMCSRQWVGAQIETGNANAGKGKLIKCYNCNGLGHIAHNCTKPKRPQNSDYFKDKMLLMQAQKNGAVLDEEELLFLAGEHANTFDADVDNHPVQDLSSDMWGQIFQAVGIEWTMLIQDRNKSEENLKKELHSVKLQPNSTMEIKRNNGRSCKCNEYYAELEAVLPPAIVYPPNTPVHLVPRTLPTTSQVNIGERGFEQTKRCYLTEVIPFFNLLKEHFDGVQKSHVTEVRAMKAVFENLEAEVDQNEIDLKSSEIERKNLLIANENLIAECLSKDISRRFHGMDDAKEIWAAIKTRFGGNANSKKMQKAVLKQQFEAFTISSKESLEKGYDRFQNLYPTIGCPWCLEGAFLVAHKLAVKKLESQLKASHKQQSSLNEKLNFQANQIFEKDEKLKKYRRIGMKAVKDKDALQKIVDSWFASSKNLWKLVDCGMSSTVKIGLGYGIKSNAEVLGYEEEMSRGTDEDIDDSLYEYGKHGPQPKSPSPTVSNASSIVFSFCPSNDSDGELGAVSDASTIIHNLSIPNDA
ncbi:integrase, catalytic region, zinc finger, CCHC-type containing protein [Tanacetum coccineum]